MRIATTATRRRSQTSDALGVHVLLSLKRWWARTAGRRRGGSTPTGPAARLHLPIIVAGTGSFQEGRCGLSCMNHKAIEQQRSSKDHRGDVVGQCPSLAWHGTLALSGRPKRTRALARRPVPGVRTGTKHVKGIEYDGVGWLMTSSGCGCKEFIALTRLMDCLKNTKCEKSSGQGGGRNTSNH